MTVWRLYGGTNDVIAPLTPPTGKVTPEYVASLSDGDHRKFNAAGQFFDKGESWSGLGECLEDVAMPAVDGFKAAIDAAKVRP